MYALLADEANLDPRSAPFFVYGGIFIPVEKLGFLDARIRDIRTAAGYRPGDILKFSTSERPKHVSIQQATEAKNQVVLACLENGVRLVAYALFHKIAAKQGRDALLIGGLRSVIRAFDRFLTAENESGFCLIDRLPLQKASAKDEFARLVGTGLRWEDGSCCPLNRIVFYSETHITSSHISSAVDIVVGCFRYCVTSPANPEAARLLMRNVAAMMWKDEKGEAWEHGLIMRPILTKIRVPEYRAEYDKLRDRVQDSRDPRQRSALLFDAPNLASDLGWLLTGKRTRPHMVGLHRTAR